MYGGGGMPGWVKILLVPVGIGLAIAFLPAFFSMLGSLAQAVVIGFSGVALLVGMAVFFIGLGVHHSPWHKDHGKHFMFSGALTSALGPTAPIWWPMAGAVIQKYGSEVVTTLGHHLGVS